LHRNEIAHPLNSMVLARSTLGVHFLAIGRNRALQQCDSIVNRDGDVAELQAVAEVLL